MEKVYRFFLILFCSLLFFIKGYSQSPDWSFAKSMGRAFSDDSGESIVTDILGNVYSTGRFSGTVDFDPGVGLFNLTSIGGYDMFISKLDSLGNFLWVKQIGGIYEEAGLSIGKDDFGNIYTTGYFRATVDFDPGLDTFNLTSVGSMDIFVLKVTDSGDFKWAKTMGGINNDAGNSIALDLLGNVYLTGDFHDTVDFNPDSVQNYTLNSVGNADIFVCKFDSSGGFIWSKSMGGSTKDQGLSLFVDDSANVCTTGYFQGSADFDPDSLTSFNLTAIGYDDIFVCKLDSSGDFEWGKGLGGLSYDYGNSIAFDATGNIYCTGSFHGTVDFDPDTTLNFSLTATGFDDIFIFKFDNSGNLKWAKKIGGNDFDAGSSLSVSLSGYVYSTGTFQGTVDFDPGAVTFNLTSSGYDDIFICKFDTSGNFIWAKSIAGSDYDISTCLAIDNLNNLYLTGNFYSPSITCGSTVLSNTSSFGNYSDIFIAKLSNVISGIESVENINGVTIYPNPAISSCTIIAPSFKLSTLFLYDITGRVLLQKNFVEQISIDLSSLNKGIYLVQLKSENGKSYVGKVIKG